MELEELNKTQIVLLTLLVSFVTSIATGIVTVTLLDQAPPAVTQTINRIVERTIERVVPAEMTSGEKEVIIKEIETTIVVKEDDLITESIEKNKRSLVRIIRVTEPPVEDSTSTISTDIMESGIFVGIGVIVSSDGSLAAAGHSVGIGENLVGIFFGGVQRTLEVLSINEDINIALLEPAAIETGAEIAFKKTTFADSKSLKLGQSVIALGGENRTNVSMGIISGLIDVRVEYPSVEDETIMNTKVVLDSIETSINSAQISGSPLFNIFGEFIGINTKAQNTTGVFTPSSKVSELLESLIIQAESDISAGNVKVNEGNES